MFKRFLIGATILSCGFSVMAQTPMVDGHIAVNKMAEHHDKSGLQNFKEKHGTLDYADFRGRTPLCVAVEQKNYAGYHMLAELGADRNHECISKMTTAERKAFNEGYMAFVKGDKIPVYGLAEDASSSLIMGAAGVALIGVAAASAGGGGGGGSGSGGGDGVDHGLGRGESVGLPDEGKRLSASDFETDEYMAIYQSITPSSHLAPINAGAAYARFYTGDKDANGNITKLYSNLKQVKVGVIDTGVFSTVSKPSDGTLTSLNDLAPNVLSGFNYDYGPCHGNDRTNCWIQGDTSTEYVLLDGAGEEVRTVQGEESYSSWALGYAADYNWDNLKNNVEPNDALGDYHGSVVSALIAGLKNDHGSHGVAFDNAKIVPVKYDLMSSMKQPIQSLVDSGVRVINASLGVISDTLNAGSDKEILSYYLQDEYSPLLTHKNTAIVFAAGNEENQYGQPSLESGLGRLDDYKDLTVVAVSVDENKQISDFSNYCGSAKDYCIAAPGENLAISLAYDNTYSHGYSNRDGTSFSAPVVSGALAFLMGAYPNMTVQNAIDLIFETATDLGDPGVDTTYGHGLLNMDAATAPVGTMSTSTNGTLSSDMVRLDNTRLRVPLAMKSATTSLPTAFAAYDKYERKFMVPTAKYVTVNSRDSEIFENQLHRFMKFDSVSRVGDETQGLAFTFSSAAKTDSDYGIGGMELVSRTKDMQTKFFFAEDTTYGIGEYADKTTLNPFVAMENAYGFENTHYFGKKYALGFGLITGQNALFKTSEDDMEDANRLSVFQGNALWIPTDKFSLTVSSGAMQETDSLLGLRGTGGFDTEDTKTYYMGVSAAVKPIKNLTLTGAYYYGMTPSVRLNALMHTTDLYSEGMAFDARYDLGHNEHVGVLLSSPLKVRKGYADMTLSTGRDYNSDAAYMETYRMNMASGAHEWDTGVYGQFNLSDTVRAKAQGMVRFNPEHQANVRPDYQLMFGLHWNWN